MHLRALIDGILEHAKREADRLLLGETAGLPACTSCARKRRRVASR